MSPQLKSTSVTSGKCWNRLTFHYHIIVIMKVWGYCMNFDMVTYIRFYRIRSRFISFYCLFWIRITRSKYQVFRIDSCKTINSHFTHFVAEDICHSISWTSHKNICALRLQIVSLVFVFIQIIQSKLYWPSSYCYFKGNVIIVSFDFCRVCTLGTGSRMV